MYGKKPASNTWKQASSIPFFYSGNTEDYFIVDYIRYSPFGRKTRNLRLLTHMFSNHNLYV